MTRTMREKTRAVFGVRLDEAIRDSLLTTEEFAKKAGVDYCAMRGYTTGRALPRQKRIQAFARLLNVSPLYLIGATSVKERDADEAEAEAVVSTNDPLEMAIAHLEYALECLGKYRELNAPRDEFVTKMWQAFDTLTKGEKNEKH